MVGRRNSWTMARKYPRREAAGIQSSGKRLPSCADLSMWSGRSHGPTHQPADSRVNRGRGVTLWKIKAYVFQPRALQRPFSARAERPRPLPRCRLTWPNWSPPGTACHGRSGRGSSRWFQPRLQGIERKQAGSLFSICGDSENNSLACFRRRRNSLDRLRTSSKLQ